MISKCDIEKGFTAIELLITLIIAAMFLFSGYQLYTQVQRDGTNAEIVARLSNVVYDKLRQKADSVGNASCVASSATANEQTTGIGTVTYTTTVSCPYSGVPVSLVKISAAYTKDGSALTVDHAMYAYSSK